MTKKPSKTHKGLEPLLKNLNFYDLEIFETVSLLGSVSGAARELRLLPPHVSKCIKRLELASEATLLNRSKSGVSLTPEGQRLLDFIRELATLAAKVPWGDALSSQSSVKAKLISIAGSSFIVSHLISKLATQMTKADASYRFRMIETLEGSLVSLALKGNCDAIIHHAKIDFPGTWITTSIAPISWALVGRVNHPLGAVTNESNVVKYPFIVPTYLTPSGFRYGDDKCPVPIQKRIRGHESQTGEAGLQAVSISDTLIFVPEIMVRERVKQGLLQTIQVRSWRPVREDLYLSINSEMISNRTFEQLLMHSEQIISKN